MNNTCRQLFCMWILLSISLLRAATSPRPAETIASSPPPIAVVQAFLRSRQETPSLAMTGEWDADTRESVRSFVLHLQEIKLWGYHWKGAKTGKYSAEFADYLDSAIEGAKTQGADAGEISNFEAFVHAMNELRSKGVLVSESAENPPSANAESASDEDADNSVSQAQQAFFSPLLMWFANGALSGFGDEIYCAAFSGPRTFSECHADARLQLDHFDTGHHALAVTANLIGSMVNVISLMLSLIAIETEWTGLSVLVLSFVLGVIDCVLYAAGDAWTAAQTFSLSGIWTQFEAEAGPIIVMSIFSGFVMAWVVAMHRWKHKHPPGIGPDAAFEAFWSHGSTGGM